MWLPCFGAAAALLLAALPASSGAIHKIDFESTSSMVCSLDGARVTNAPGSVLAGDKSLLADFSASDKEWNEYLTTNEQVLFQPGHTYHVSFSYRILNPGGPKTQFYSLLRSRSGGDIYGEFWLWNRETGAEGTIHRLFRVEKKDDWMLILGVRRQGSILIDDITISVCDEQVPGYGKPIKPSKTDLIETKVELDAIRKSEGLGDTLRDMLIVWCNEGAGRKIVETRQEYARQHNPDFVDWNLCGPLAQEFGVRSSSGGPEYQEFYKMEGPDVWNSRFQRFIDNGFSVSLDNTLIQDETWGEGGYFTCHNGKGWHDWFIRELLKINANQFGMCQDNIACATFYKGHGCFCKPCIQGFRKWLESRYTADELAQFGINDIGTFSYLDRATRYGLIGNQALGDPVTREYVKFQFCTQLAAWADVVKAVKADSTRRGFPIPCYGNQIGGAGSGPFAVAIGEFCDVIEIEEVIGVGSKIPNWSLNYKMGRASGQESKPVWVRGAVHDNKNERAPQLSPLFWQTHFAEALANGGVRDISFGINAPWTGDPATLDYIDSPEVQRVWKQYSDLCNANRAVFTNRTSLAQVALIYSLPSTLFRRFYTLQIDDNAPFAEFDKAAATLDTAHVPYDCVVFGHSEVFPTAITQLNNYKVIVLPATDALSDVQIAFLRDFTARGGVVIKTGDIGTKDENLNDRPGNAAAAFPTIDLVKEPDRATQALRAASPVTVDGPDTVTANLWLSSDGASVDLHLVNYGADLTKATWDEMKPLTVAVQLPKGFSFDTARLIGYERPPATLDCKRVGDTVNVTVQPFGSYAVISFAQKSRLDAANEAASKRREQDRREVMRLAKEKNLY